MKRLPVCGAVGCGCAAPAPDAFSMRHLQMKQAKLGMREFQPGARRRHWNAAIHLAKCTEQGLVALFASIERPHGKTP